MLYTAWRGSHALITVSLRFEWARRPVCREAPPPPRGKQLAASKTLLRPASGLGSLREGLLEEDGPKGGAGAKLGLVSGSFLPATWSRGEAGAGAPSTAPAPGAAGTPSLQARELRPGAVWSVQYRAARPIDDLPDETSTSAPKSKLVLRNCRGFFSDTVVRQSQIIGAALRVIMVVHRCLASISSSSSSSSSSQVLVMWPVLPGSAAGAFG